jgi:hypothetical protein
MTRALHNHETRPGGVGAKLRRRVPPQRLMNLVNPAVRAVAESPAHALLDRSTLVLHVVGRRSGHRYDIPVSHVDVGGELFVTTQHAWRHNLRDGVDLQVTTGGQRRTMHAELEEDPELVARALKAIIDRLGWRIARRRLGLHMAGHASPTIADLQRMVEAADLAVITLTSDDTWRDGVVDPHWSVAAR